MHSKNNSIKNINILRFPILESTNQKLYQLAEQNCADWTVVQADSQTQGKGYHGNSWISAPNCNVTLSFLLRNPFDLIQDLPVFNMWISVKIQQFLTKWQVVSFIKWPNDIYSNQKKIGGILIENKIQANKTKFTVVGIGINLNQTEFENLPNATSIKLIKPGFSLNPSEFAEEFMDFLYQHKNELNSLDLVAILEDYHQVLYAKKEFKTYQINGEVIQAKLLNVDQFGHAYFEFLNGNVKPFGHKEISLVE